MSREDYIAVAARLFSIYLLYLVVSSAPGAVQAVTMSSDGMVYLGWYVTATVVCLAIAALLWLFPLTIARKLLPVMKEPRSDTAVNGPLAMSIGLSLLGVWLLAGAFADSAYWLVYLAQLVQQPGYENVWHPHQTARLVAILAQWLLGLVLIFGNAGIRRLILRLRYGKHAPGE